jgi:hypothetical protein
MGLLLTGHRVRGERPGLSRLARPRPRLRQAKTPSHRVDKAKDAHRPRPSLPCLLASATKNAAHSPGRDQHLPDELPDPKNYARPEKPMSVPVTLHFLQYVYIGGRVVSQSTCARQGMLATTHREAGSSIGKASHVAPRPCASDPPPHTLPCSYAHRSRQRGPPPCTMP